MHLLHYPLPTASILNPSYCFLPLPCGTFHLWLLSFLFCLTVDYATGEPLFQISTKYSISSAAYLEWTGADILVTENRHFLRNFSSLPFKILNAAGCIKLIKF